MSHHFSLAEKLAMYKNKNKLKEAFTLPEKVEGSTILQKFEKLCYLTSNRPLSTCQTLSSNTSNECYTIAICLIIVDSLPFEDIWKEWMAQSSIPNCLFKTRLIIHAKYPERIRSNWVRQHTLHHSYRPEWNSVEVIRAMMACLVEGVREKSCGRFIFGTESCIPLRSLQETGEIVFERDLSWLDCYHRPKDGFEDSSCFRTVNASIIPPQCVWKSLPGWIMLTRSHALEIVALREIVDYDYISAFNNVFAPEEIFFPTILSVLGLLHDERERERDEVERKRVTYARWARKGEARPEVFDIHPDTFFMMRESGAVFGRKFTQERMRERGKDRGREREKKRERSYVESWRDAILYCEREKKEEKEREKEKEAKTKKNEEERIHEKVFQKEIIENERIENIVGEKRGREQETENVL
mmetsp:Transcript_38500/g.39185  ORF Transcript_38500/g.39185 Transcript_38500/m.39185 type:complete len:414 (-) Transcript_38500:96-1337(-)